MEEKPINNHALEEKRYCSQCGTEIVMGSKFCPKCGKKLAEDASRNKNSSIQAHSPVNNQANNMPTNPEQVLCPECHGSGETRKTWRMITSILVVLFVFVYQLLLLGVSFLGALYRGNGSVFFWSLILNIMLDVYMLYWGFKKQTCSVCHGRGRVYL
jgi:predicted nucleic acid-binding Zn ribbon protein